MNTPEPALREKILNAATHLFIQHGYHGLAMRQIAEALQVSKPALYYHFKDKEQLFLAILKTYLDELEISIDQISSEELSSREKIARFIELVLSQPAGERAIIRLASQEMSQLSAPARKSFESIYREKFIGKIEAILKSGMQRAELKSIRPEVATWTLLGMMYPYLYPTHAETSHPENSKLSEDTIQQIISIYLDGISSQAAK
jgi:AcrR family transcriptional regulator